MHATTFLGKKMRNTYFASIVFSLNVNGGESEQNGGGKVDKEKRKQEQCQQKKQY